MHIFRQNDNTPKPDGGWGPKKLGVVPKGLTPELLEKWPTMGGQGCAVCSLTHALRRLRPRTFGKIRPDQVHDELVAKCPGAFFNGCNLVWEVAALHFGLVARDKDRLRSKPGDPGLAALAIATLDAGGVAVVHVDTDSTLATGDPAGEHFITAFRRVGPSTTAPAHIECADSAPRDPGDRLVWLDENALTGSVAWHKTLRKTYKAVSVIPFTLAEGIAELEKTPTPQAEGEVQS